jgi:hypothetical protein
MLPALHRPTVGHPASQNIRWGADTFRRFDPCSFFGRNTDDLFPRNPSAAPGNVIWLSGKSDQM